MFHNLFSKFHWGNSYGIYKRRFRDWLGLEYKPQRPTKEDIMALLDSPPISNIKMLKREVTSLESFINRIPEEGGEQWDARMTQIVISIKSYLNKVEIEYGLS